MFERTYNGSDHAQRIINGTFDWSEFPKYTITVEQVCRNWIYVGLDQKDYELVNVIFDKLGIPGNLTLKERICYWQLLGDNK